MNVQKSKLNIEKYGRRMTMFIISEWHKLCGERKLGNKTKEKYQEPEGLGKLLIKSNVK